MKRMKRSVIIMFTLLMLLTTTMTSFAATFADVGTNHWARQHVEKMEEKSIISGMTEGGKLVFKPESAVSRVQAIHMIYRTLRATNKLQSTENFTSKYQTVMASYNIPEWGYEAVSYAYEKGIITGAELGNLMVGTQQVSATRQQVAVYLGKAIDVNAQVSSTSPLTFIDRELIDTAALPYVQLLVSNKIISGDNNNKFNPKNTITRAQMASICSKAYDVLDTVNIVVEVPVPVQEETKTTTKFGTIDYVVIETNTVFVRDGDNIEIYQVASNTEIIVDGVKRVINSLSKGQDGKFVFDGNNKLIKIEINASANKYKGFIEYLTTGESYNTIIVRDDYNTTNKRKTFKVYNSDHVNIQLDDKNATFKDLEEETQVEVIYDGDRALKIVSYSNNMQDVAGILEASVNFAKYPFKITVRVANNEIKDYEITESVTVRRNGKKADLEDLVRGDIVSLIVEKNNKISRITATSTKTSNKKKDEGIIQSIAFDRPNKITIINEDDDEITYEVDNNVSIYLDDTRSTIYDLRIGHNIEIEVQGNVITEIEGKKTTAGNRITGEIVSIYDNIDRIIVRIYDSSTRKYDEISVYINKDTTIYTDDGKERELRYLARKDEVFIYGSYEHDVFVATKIMVIND
ncbi:S-layer homology domain-containing protein [Anaerovirgula multivorans]|uniref:S-layer homology domain-containing protein n=1 Tax=Anaerovirgula multivorans TaxID=312168 RepID=A0A239EIG1_9FIRM|nr:S-layer homology domain-containing protein [Anaerovirgula multivorans]SNS43813.1 S-layer homology domain-containing protein [Anaerovirgula multivorans]